MEQEEGRTRIAVVEDKRVTREGIAAILEETPDLHCVGAFGSMEQALEALEKTPCEVILLDIQLPGMSGVEGARLLSERFPKIRILMLTVYEDAEKVFQSIRNGACGYLLKKTPPARLIEAVRQARRGESPLSSGVARHIVRFLQSRKTLPSPLSRSTLSPQELAVLRMLADGHSYASSAEQLEITINTVRDYVRSIYEKLQVHTKSEAVSQGLRRKLIE
jgi:DNA-binding NarL/FixJ family response regulator